MKKPAKKTRDGRRRRRSRYRHLVGRLDPARAHASPARRTEPPRHRRRPPTAPVNPRVVLGMTLYNNAAHLPARARLAAGAVVSADFRLLLLDDASADDTETIARATWRATRACATSRHAERQAMVATWREVAEQAAAECPSARVLCLGQRPRLVAPALARAAGRRARRRRLARCSPIRSPGACRRAGRAREGAAPVRHRGVRHARRPLAALLPRRRRLRRHGLRPDADGGAAAGGHVPAGAAAGPAADGGADAAGPHPPGARSAVVPPAVDGDERRAPAHDADAARHRAALVLLAAVVSALAGAVAGVRGRAGRRRSAALARHVGPHGAALPGSPTRWRHFRKTDTSHAWGAARTASRWRRSARSTPSITASTTRSWACARAPRQGPPRRPARALRSC